MALVASIPSLLFDASVIALIVSLLLTALLRYYAKEVKWIEKESESLQSLAKDFDQLMKDVAEVETQARSFWDSEINLSGMHAQLSNNVTEWMESITEVVADANNCVTIFNQLSQELYLTACFRVVPIVDFVIQIKRTKRAIVDKLNQNKMSIRDINESMERSRSKNRSILRVLYSLQEDNSIPALEPVQMQSSTSIIGLTRRNKDLFCGMEEILLETESQMNWVKQANELIAEAEKSIDAFRGLVLTFGNNLILRNKFRREMKCISTAVENLLNKKGEYHLEFIDRTADKSISFSIYQDTDGRAIISAMKSTLSEFAEIELSWEQIYEISSMFNSVENMYNKIYVREESTFRSVCLEQIKCIAKELDSSLQMYKREPQLKHVKKFNQIKQATTLLQNIIDVCYIKRQCSSSVVDLGIDIQELVSQLTTEEGDNHPVISIVGMMGVGKTTLAMEVYNNRTIVNHFSGRAWITMPFMNDIHSDLDPLKEKPSLVVLDNVSSTEELDELNVALSGMANGSRIVFTTRFENVASYARSRPYHLRLRTKEESWKLLQMVTSKPKLDTTVEKLARKVVGRCWGLPLSILSLQCLMSTNALSYEQLLRALKRINQGQNQMPWLKSWSQNYEDLNETLYKCLLYFTLFPQDFEIPARRLVILWVAEGLVETLEVAEKYLEDLRNLNMIQAVELKSNGKIKTFRLPNVLRELISTSNQSLSTHSQQHFTYPFQHQGASPSQILSLDATLANVLNNAGNPVSFHFFDTREKNEPGKLIEHILTKGITGGQFKELRVLDLERVYKPQLPKIISKLTELRYLGLRWTFLETVPSFIGDLSNLETLDVKHTCIRSLPHSIWKLKKLRNLYLSQSTWSKIEGKLIGKFPENLQTLCGLFIYESSPLLHDLHRLKNLKKLKLTFQLTQTEQEVLAKLIVQQEQLHSLTLRSIDEMGKPQGLCLSDMSKLYNLSSLYLFGNLDGRLREQKLPPNITDLTLSASKLSQDPMPQMQNLLKLRSLCLYSESYTGIRMHCTADSFPQLQVLRLWMLKDLEEWIVENGAMPKLIELEIRCCSKLEVPCGLKHLKTLHKIRLSSMPEKFITTIEENKTTFWNNVEIIYD
ncbi:P-loop containing nucleoside triphosphate hydrolase [Sesbania bispinosa]|nr:P-loop containing nucleoside triphosphate hydrolase [Sesbania bispinosa]